jgi:hypothetical protein
LGKPVLSDLAAQIGFGAAGNAALAENGYKNSHNLAESSLLPRLL